MSLAVVVSRALTGMEAPAVSVEVHLAGGLPGVQVVGLPEAEVRESRDRVRAALQTAHFEFPNRRITVNLAPADLPKESGRFDLPIALGILAASQQIPAAALERHEFAGELALTGELRAVRGALAMVLGARPDGRAFVLPRASAAEAALVPGATVYAAGSLLEVCAHLKGTARLPAVEPVAPPPSGGASGVDLADVRGQHLAKRALEIAAAGGHSMLLSGPPGAGKSMLAQRLPTLLPPLTESEALEVAAIASIAGRFDPSRWRERPYRSPHHTASPVALCGGGGHPRPGEISLAHRGVLFLDELPEWERRALEVLREPIESGVVHIARAARQASFPAQFQLIAAMNPCPCGWLGHASGRCRCTPERVAGYRARISGPLIDRIDLAIDVPALPPADIASDDGEARGEPSAAVRARVIVARERQIARPGTLNARLAVGELARAVCVDPAAQALAQRAMARFGLSARGYHRMLKVARTIADLAGDDTVGPKAMGEAVGYRRFDDGAGRVAGEPAVTGKPAAVR
ncbi:MAG: YifB family Mg chelatase-like AAA ATPase [Burkholderiales bacterium]|nr:YifB family Mg chelatase-like AAA ATPase [Burkholderiales bacterium]